MMVGIVAWLFYALQNPSFLNTIGLEVGTIKSILLMVSILFFGILFFVWFFFLALNGYRLLTIKEWSKIKYIIWLILGLMIVILSIVLGTIVIIKINQMVASRLIDTKNMIFTYLQVKGNTPEESNLPIWSTKWLKLIAPSRVSFQLNKDLFRTQIMDRLGQFKKFNNFRLDCGNGQVLTVGSTLLIDKGRFGNCLYTDKWAYPITLVYTYTDIRSNQSTSETINALSLNFEAQVAITKANGGKPVLSERKDEILIGTAPSKLEFDVTRIFSDLGLPENKIIWDINWDGINDKIDKVNFTYTYTQPKLQYAYFSLPGLRQGLYYKFDLRVDQGDVPGCTIALQSQSNDGDYSIKSTIDDPDTDISRYTFEIFDIRKDQVVKTLNAPKWYLTYRFPSNGQFQVRLTFVTTEGKEWYCESDGIDVWVAWYTANYDLRYAYPKAQWRSKVAKGGTGVRLENQSLIIDKLPIKLRMRVNSITPLTKDEPKLKVYLQDDEIVSAQGQIYEMIIQDDKNQNINLIIKDIKGKSSESIIPVMIRKQHLIADVIVDKILWEDPLVVNFDASITELNDSQDEVVYFTWVFGDGEMIKNVSQAQVTHTYRFDVQKQEGVYYPKLIVKTRKGFEDEMSLTEPIVVKRATKKLTINIDSHPAQVASVGDTVRFSLEGDGNIKSIKRTFGNDRVITCQDRTCSEVGTVYDLPWEYQIHAEVQYPDTPSIFATIKLKVEE